MVLVLFIYIFESVDIGYARWWM